MKSPLSLFAIAALFLAGCGDSSKPASGNGGGVTTAPADYGNALASGQSRAINTVDLAALTQAVQMFNVNEGRFPKDLNELVQAKMIGKIPDAPHGKKIAYDPATGKVSMVAE